MVPSTRPIKNIHVSAFDGSRSLWSRWITHASDYRFRQKRLQIPSGNPHCTVYTPHQGRPFFCPPPSPFLCARAPHLPHSLTPSLPPSARHASRAVLTFVFFLHAFHVLPRSPPRPLPECLLISCSFLEASGGLRCRPPPACGGAPGAVLVCFADHCFILRTIRQR